VGVAAATVVLIAAGARASGSHPTVPRARATTTVATTTVPRTTTTRTTTTTTTLPARRLPARRLPAPHRIAPSTTTTRPTTTTTLSPAQQDAARAAALQLCLALAAANHDKVVAANEEWYLQELTALKAHHLLKGKQAVQLALQEQQAQTEIDAEQTIDVSNCYLKSSTSTPSTTTTSTVSSLH